MFFTILECSLSPESCCAFPSLYDYGHIPFKGSLLVIVWLRSHCSEDWEVSTEFFFFLPHPLLPFAFQWWYWTQYTLPVSSYLFPQCLIWNWLLLFIALNWHWKPTAPIIVGPVLCFFFFLTTGGRQGHWALSEVFHQRNWCSWYSRAHELSPQAALTIVFFHSMSNWVGIARPPVGHSNWGDMETLLPLPGIQGI